MLSFGAAKVALGNDFWAMIAALATTATAALLLWDRVSSVFARDPVRIGLRWTGKDDSAEARQIELLIVPPASGTIELERVIAPAHVHISTGHSGATDGFGNVATEFEWTNDLDIRAHVPMTHENGPLPVPFWVRRHARVPMRTRGVLTIVLWAERRRLRLKVEIPHLYIDIPHLY